MECPNCKRNLTESATFCAFCGWQVGGGTVGRAVTNLAQVGKEAAQTGLRILEKAGRAIEPVVEKGVKTVADATKPVVEKARPHVEKASRTIERAVDKGVTATKKAVRKVKEKAR